MSRSEGYDSQGNISIFSVAPQILKAKEKMSDIGIEKRYSFSTHIGQRQQWANKKEDMIFFKLSANFTRNREVNIISI